MSDSVRPHRRQPTRLLCPWDAPGKNTGVGCHFLLQCMKVKSESEVSRVWLLARVLEWGAIAFSWGTLLLLYKLPDQRNWWLKCARIMGQCVYCSNWMNNTLWSKFLFLHFLILQYINNCTCYKKYTVIEYNYRNGKCLCNNWMGNWKWQ